MASRALARALAGAREVVGVDSVRSCATSALGRSGAGARAMRARWSDVGSSAFGRGVGDVRAIARWESASARMYATALADRGVKGQRAGMYGMGASILKRDRDADGVGRKGQKAVVSASEEGSREAAAVDERSAGEMASAHDYMLPVRAYYVGSMIDVRALAKQLPAYPKEFNREGVIIRMSPKMEQGDMSALDGDAPIPPDMLSRYLVVFKFGSVVFYNMGLREREECLKLARTFTSTPLPVPMTDDYRVVVRPGLADWASLENDHIVLKRMDINNISVISSVLAQTVALEHYEQKVDGMVEIFSKLNKSTELTGDLNISKKRLFSLVAENNNTLTELITKLGLLGRSDTAWQYAQYNLVWEGLRQDFELEERFQDLDYKLNLIQTQVKFYLEILQNRKSDALEWIIIVLISLEICVSLYDMSDKIPSIPWPPL
ncbi:Protein of unknown function DUF155 [Ostreococcus tauri]|uniref:DUF155 domain-containing protein n=1 Tax=Ostreococcus tauri TaxID=70448 RepID=A0A090N3L8_OSTTA|nr:Protein of unknown function DUF155 [Ostreococcus tauri]CEF98343.1 Protein of unknown function DUF155 [Ostreococcus tauri]|eukprot:XP_003079842.2 Protein of unknown function DUF155 [Ostreococcus tauri]